MNEKYIPCNSNLSMSNVYDEFAIVDESHPHLMLCFDVSP